MNEIELKAHLVKSFSPNFIIKPEVSGHFLVEDTSVIIDYMMYPKPHLIEQNFDPVWFGVEVKAPGDYANSAKRGIQVAWQAITYSQSEFNGIRPAFVLVYPDLRSFFVNGPRQHHDAAAYITCLLQKANVGYIEIDDDKQVWKISFGAGGYFRSDKGRSKTPNAGIKRHTGTWK